MDERRWSKGAPELPAGRVQPFGVSVPGGSAGCPALTWNLFTAAFCARGPAGSP